MLNPRLESIKFKCISYLGRVGKETYTYYSSLPYKELLELYWKALDTEKLNKVIKEEPNENIIDFVNDPYGLKINKVPKRPPKYTEEELEKLYMFFLSAVENN